MSHSTNCENLSIHSEQKYLRFPSAYLKDVHICSYDSDKGYVIRMKFSSREEFFTFMNKWSVKTLTKWRVRKSDPREMCAGLKNVFWQAYHCQNTSYRLQSKSTGCKAAFKVTIRKINKRCRTFSRSKDIHIPEYPTIIIGHFRHNHAAMLSNKKFESRGVAEEVVGQFINLFNSGVTPVVALAQYKAKLKEEYKDDYCNADRPLCPDRKWCQRLFAHVKRKKLNIKTEDYENDEGLKETVQNPNQHAQFYLKHSQNTLQSLSTNNNASNIKLSNITENSEALKQFTFFTNYIKEKMDDSPEYCQAVKEFNNSCRGFKSDMEMLKALRMFGGNNKKNTAPVTKLRIPALDKRKNNCKTNRVLQIHEKFEEIFLKNEKQGDHTYSQDA